MNRSTVIEFLKSQIAAFASTCLDYLSVLFLTEKVGIWYIYSNIIGATAGAVSNFFLGRKWTFRSETTPIQKQAIRYALVALGSLFLNTAGLYVLTEWLEMHYMISKVLVGIFVAICFNYLLQKYFVFQQP